MAILITLYSRPQCHLCDDARLMIERICSGKDLAWQEINIETDPQLQERYGEFIPVVMVNDDQVGYWRIEAAALESAIDRAMAPSQPSTKETEPRKGWFRRRNMK